MVDNTTSKERYEWCKERLRTCAQYQSDGKWDKAAEILSELDAVAISYMQDNNWEPYFIFEGVEPAKTKALIRLNFKIVAENLCHNVDLLNSKNKGNGN